MTQEPSTLRLSIRSFTASVRSLWLMLGMVVRPNRLGFATWRKLVGRVLPRVLLSVIMSALLIPMMFAVMLLTRPSRGNPPGTA